LLHLREQTKLPLLDVAVELTNHCQLSCSMCWSQNPRLQPPRPKGYMKFSLFKHLINELEAYWSQTPIYQGKHVGRSPFTVAFSYVGESLLHPQFKEFIEYLVDSGLWCRKVIYTNGLLLDKYVNLLATHFYRVNLSYHNPPRKEVLENVKMLKQKRGSRGKPAIYGNIVRDEFNEYDLCRAISAFKPLVDVLTVKGMMTEDLRYANGYRQPRMCQSPFFYLTVLWNGDTLPCCKLLSSGSFSMGKIQDGLEAVWLNSKFEDLRNHRLEGYPCEDCMLYRGLASHNLLTYAVIEGYPMPRLT